MIVALMLACVPHVPDVEGEPFDREECIDACMADDEDPQPLVDCDSLCAEE